jgi:diguanylate cyclase (GGDEF)-like protein/PAS domain S-box-containing protein
VSNTAIRTRDEAFESRVLAEQTRQLYAAVPVIVALTVVVSVLLVAIHWPLRPHAALLGWLALYSTVAVIRLELWRRYRHARPGIADAGRWYHRLAILTLASALVWSAAAWLFLVENSEGHMALMAFVVAGLGAGGIINLAPRWQAAWLFLLPTLLPFALRFYLIDIPLADEIALFIVVYTVALMALSWRFSHMVTRQIRTALEQSDESARSQHERQRYQSLVESTRAIVWEAEPDSLRFTYVSPEVETVLGYPAHCWTEEPDFWLQHIHPEDRDWAPTYCRRMTEGLRDHMFDYRMHAADGRTVWLRDSVKVLVREGRPETVVGVMIDITELKTAQEELEYGSGLQQLMVEAAQQFLNTGEADFDRILDQMLARVGTWCSVDRAYLMRFTSDLSHFTNTHEWTSEGVRPEIDSLQRISTDAIPRLLDQLRLGETAIVSCVDQLPDAWCLEKQLFSSQDIRSLLVLPILHGEQLIGLIGFDVVKQERAWHDQEVGVLRVLANLVGAALNHSDMERRLRASERLRTEAESLAAMGSWEWRIGSEAFHASAEWRRVFGCSDAPLTRSPVLELTPEVDREQVALALADSIETGEAYETEHRIIRPSDGKQRWVKVHAELFEDAEGRLLRGFAQDITDRKRAESKLFELAHYDSLTGLPNRLLVLDRLQRALKRARRNASEVAVLFLDLDQFKKVNDTLGHDAGDLALVEAAKRLLHVVRDGDTVARIGGDEFVVVLDEFTSLGDVIAVATKVLDAFRLPLQVNGREFILTASVGAAVSPHDGSSAPDLMRNADTAMYHAKHSGRDGFQFFTASMNESVRRQLEVEHALRGAIDRGEIRVAYQPLVRLPERRIVGAEALLRWIHPELGDIPPDEFIDVAEQSGLIGELGDFVFRNVFVQLVEWRRPSPDFFVSINVSPRQFRDLDLAERLIDDLGRAGLPGQSIELEVTEGLLLSGRSEVMQSLEQLRNHGIGLVMDDFGTGYASLSYLRDYPFSSIKIDRSFVEGMDRDSRKHKLVTSAIRLARALDLTVIAEGVETREELDVLLSEKCDLAQGFLFSRAMDPERLGALLTEQSGSAVGSTI